MPRPLSTHNRNDSAHDDESRSSRSKAPSLPAGSHRSAGGVESGAGTSRCLRPRRRRRQRRLLVKSSSWIRSLRYVPADIDGVTMPYGTDGFLVVVTHEGRAYAYAVPSWTAGLLVAAQARGLSVGSAFNKLVKRRRYPSVKLTEDDN